MTITLSGTILALVQKQAAQAGFDDDLEAYLGTLVEEADDRAETLAAIQEGLADVEAGRVRPAREVLAELANRFDIPTGKP